MFVPILLIPLLIFFMPSIFGYFRRQSEAHERDQEGFMSTRTQKNPDLVGATGQQPWDVPQTRTQERQEPLTKAEEITTGDAEIVRTLIQQHAETLMVKRLQKRRVDSYGIRDDTNWDKEIVYFLENVVYPKLPAIAPAGKDLGSDRDFRILLAHDARELRDEALQELRAKYAPKRDRLQEKVRKAREKLASQRAEASKTKWDAAVSFGNSVLGAFLGRKTTGKAKVGRASSAARAAGNAMRHVDVGQAEADLDAALQEFTEMEIAFKDEVDRLWEMVRPEMLMFDLKGIMDAELDGYESRRPTSRADIAGMSPLDFESFCATLLTGSGWSAVITKASGDQGVDIVARKKAKKAVFQCKLYSSPVGNKAVQEILAGKAYESADLAFVVSNADYTPAAVELAAATGVRLVHYSELSTLDRFLDA
jgi:hypothetical protein